VAALEEALDTHASGTAPGESTAALPEEPSAASTRESHPEPGPDASADDASPGKDGGAGDSQR
jgi:hypothetical protein